MRFIHTYLPTERGGGKITKSQIYQLCLSFLLVKKNYETCKIILYTNKEIKSIIENIGLDYDEINTDVLDNINVKTFSIPKLIVYAAQREPFIHIDMDTFIFDRIDIDDRLQTYSTYPEWPVEINLTKSNINFYKVYFEGAFKINHKLEDKFLTSVRLRSIPNMSFFGGQNFKLISEASKYCLSIYYDNQEFFDEDYYRACIIEQLFIPAAMRMLNNDPYGENTNFKFLYDGNPTDVEFSETEDEFPILIGSKRDKYKQIELSNEIDMFNNCNYNFEGFVHLNGFKNKKFFIFMIKHKIINDFNRLDLIEKINENFEQELEIEPIYERFVEFLKNNTPLPKKTFQKKGKLL